MLYMLETIINYMILQEDRIKEDYLRIYRYFRFRGLFNLPRDFTFNALYVGNNNKLHDYYNGQSDLNESKICFIGEIEDRIKEDYLRIYRYFRFRGLFNLPKTSLSDQKIVEKYIHESLAVLTNDVIRQEILKMFNMSFPLNCFYISHQTLQKFKWVEIVQEHFIRTKYDLGLNKCLNKIDNLIN